MISRHAFILNFIALIIFVLSSPPFFPVVPFTASGCEPILSSRPGNIFFSSFFSHHFHLLPRLRNTVYTV